MSESTILYRQQEELTEIVALLDDNEALQKLIHRQIEHINGRLLVVDAKEQREADEALMKLKMADTGDETAKKVKEAVDYIAKTDDEKKQYKAALESMSVADTKALDTFGYLKDKGLTVEQIKLVLGL